MVVLCTDVEAFGEPVLAELDAAVVESDPLSVDHPDLAKARALVVGVHDDVTEEVLDAAPELELVVTRSTGIDNVDVEACRRRGVEARHLPEYATWAVAEMVVAALVVLLGNALLGHARAEEGRWDRQWLLSTRLRDAEIGVVGVGRIGSEVAGRLTDRGATVRGYDVDPDPTFGPEGFAWVDSLEAALTDVDAVTLHVPLTDSTRAMIGDDELAAMPDDAVLVNTARGGVVDTDALLAALEDGGLAGAYLDVLAGEPDPPGLAELASHPNVLVTPHLASYDERTAKDRYRLAAEIVRDRL